MVSKCTKYEVSRFTRYEAVNGGAKCKKQGGLGGQGALKVIDNVAIRQSAYDFLFDFNRNYVSILYRFRHITGYISKTVQDRCMVSIKVKQEVVCALSTGGIAHDFECPRTTPFSAFCTDIHCFVTGEPGDFKFGTLTYHSTSHPAEEKTSLKGAWSGSNNPFQNFTPHVISPQRLTLETSDFVHGSAI